MTANVINTQLPIDAYSSSTQVKDLKQLPGLGIIKQGGAVPGAKDDLHEHKALPQNGPAQDSVSDLIAALPMMSDGYDGDATCLEALNTISQTRGTVESGEVKTDTTRALAAGNAAVAEEFHVTDLTGQALQAQASAGPFSWLMDIGKFIGGLCIAIVSIFPACNPVGLVGGIFLAFQGLDGMVKDGSSDHLGIMGHIEKDCGASDQTAQDADEGFTIVTTVVIVCCTVYSLGTSLFAEAPPDAPAPSDNMTTDPNGGSGGNPGAGDQGAGDDGPNTSPDQAPSSAGGVAGNVAARTDMYVHIVKAIGGVATAASGVGQAMSSYYNGKNLEIQGDIDTASAAAEVQLGNAQLAQAQMKLHINALEQTVKNTTDSVKTVLETMSQSGMIIAQSRFSS